METDHYYAYRRLRNRWYLVKDKKVDPVTEGEVMTDTKGSLFEFTKRYI